MVTAGTYRKRHIISSRRKLDLLQDNSLGLAGRYGLTVEAWAFFTNHYHVIFNCDENPELIRDYVRHLHSQTARLLNEIDNTPGRQVWFQYRDTQLTTQKSYYARLNYVMQNPVRHRLVTIATQYPWCSASWFLANSTSAHFRTVTSFPVERQQVFDPFVPESPES